MLYENFLLEIEDEVRNLCEEGDEVSLQKIMKNNSVELDALLIRRKGCNISPTIYLKTFYEDYEKGEGLKSIAEAILAVEKSNRPGLEMDVRTFLDFSRISGHIRMKLVNTQRNQSLLAAVPHRQLLDLSIVYYISFPNFERGYATSTIYNSHMNNWEVSEDELYDLALQNMDEEGLAAVPMIDVVKSMLPSDATEELEKQMELLCAEDKEKMMYVASNSARTFGASLLANSNFLDSFYHEHGNFYVIPSSIHELILWPEGGATDEETMLSMVREVNDTQLSTEELLSYQIYFFDGEEESLSCIRSCENDR